MQEIWLAYDPDEEEVIATRLNEAELLQEVKEIYRNTKSDGLVICKAVYVAARTDPTNKQIPVMHI